MSVTFDVNGTCCTVVLFDNSAIAMHLPGLIYKSRAQPAESVINY